MEAKEIKIEQVIAQIKKDMEKIYPDMEAEMPVDSAPQSVEKVKHIAAVASSNSMRLALFARALAQHIKQKEAEITLEHLNAKDLSTPKDEHLKAYYKKELSEVYSYYDLVQNMLNICKQRVTLAQTFLRNLQQEDFGGKLEI